MATHADIANRQAERKLRMAGLNPDGSPIEDQDDREDDDRDEDDREDDQDERDDDDRNHQDDGGEGDDDDQQDLRRQVRALTQQLSAMQGRVGPAQQDLEDLRRVASTQRQQLEAERQNYQSQIDELRAQLEQRQLEEIDPTEFLSEEERDTLDPTVLKAIGKVAAGLARKALPKVDVRSETLRVLQEQEQNRIKQHRQKVLTDSKYGLQKLSTLANDPRFLAWAQKDDNEVDSAVNSLLSATSTEEIDRYARILQRKLTRYQEEQKDPASRRNNPASPRNTLAAGMRRSAGKKLTDSEMQQKLQEARRLARSPKQSDRDAAQKILDSLPS